MPFGSYPVVLVLSVLNVLWPTVAAHHLGEPIRVRQHERIGNLVKFCIAKRQYVSSGTVSMDTVHYTAIMHQRRTVSQELALFGYRGYR